MNFYQHPPSSAWEPIPLAADPLHPFWAWFKPPSAPHGVVVQIPVETFRAPDRRWPITPRSLIESLKIEPRSVASWSIQGMLYESLNGENPAWNFPIHEPASNADPMIAIFLHPVQAGTPATAAQSNPYSETELHQIFGRMEAEWTAALFAETQLSEASRQLNAALTRCNSLNRDLSGLEAASADQADKQEWLEARRRLRDVAHRLSRYLKDQHIGTTTDAGQRPVFELIYEKYVVPRKYFDGIEKADRDFEARRKSLQFLLNNMKSAQALTANEAEGRAKQILTRIAAKVRTGRSKR
ncbi:MAG: hypothetical protein U0903_19340 [Planctomycetales bacterium]